VASPAFLVMHGHLVIAGYEPDGDSVRFVADSPDLFRRLQRGYRIRKSTRDGSVQLRLESIDAPELHYGSAAQPLGDTARDTLLGWLGFHDVVYQAGTTKVTSAAPDSVPAVILTKMSDPNGRPVSYLVLGDGQDLPDGTWTIVGADLLDRTLNARALTEGMAYPTFYTSTPADHATYLQVLSGKARQDGLGLWPADRTSGFQLTDQASIGADGQLLLPKLFRRATDYLKDAAHGFQGNLGDWLLANGSTATRQENDEVVLPGGVEVHLSDLIRQQNSWISFTADVNEIVFVEK
jgi:endonuclease YncB( thermonuclease family)